MYFQHAPAIWRDFPQLAAGVLAADHIHSDVAVDAQIAPFLARAQARLEGSTEAELAEVQAWRRAYRQMGLKPTQYRSAAEALLRRFRADNELPRLHPLVDLCNAMSLAFALPVAVFDRDQIADFLEVRYAAGGEPYLAFSGEVEPAAPNEVIFADGAGQVHARRWTFRQSRRSTVTAETRRVLIVSEGLHASAAADVAELIATLDRELGALWVPPSAMTLLRADAPRFAIDELPPHTS